MHIHWLQFRLSTCVMLMALAGVQIGANIVPKEYPPEGDRGLRKAPTLGWPIATNTAKVLDVKIHPEKYVFSRFEWWRTPVNIFLNFTILIVFTAFIQYIQRPPNTNVH